MKRLLIILAIVSHSLVAQQVDSLLHQITQVKDSQHAEIYNQLSVKMRSRDLDSALLYAQMANEAAVTNQQTAQQALANKNIGVVHWFTNEMDSALLYYRRGLEGYREMDDTDKMASVYNNISMVFTRRAEFDTAIVVIQKALALNRANNDSSSVGNNYINLGVLYGEMGNTSAEIQTYREAIAYQVDAMDVIYSNMAALMIKMNKGADSAIYYNHKALAVCRSDWLRARIYLNLGPYFRETDQLDSAKYYLDKGLAFPIDPSSDMYVKAKMDRANLYEYDGDNTTAKHGYLAMAAVAQEQQYNGLLLELWTSLARVNVKMGNWQEAYNWNERKNVLNDSLTNVDNSKHLTSLQAKFEYEQNQRKIGELTKENLQKEVQMAKDRNFMIAIIGVFIILVLLAVILFINYRRKQEKKTQELALNRLEIEQRMLRSQMNPHFIFNALNSIQSYVTTNKAYEAEVFLSKFSLLIRKILENSAHKTIALEEEVETLQLYLDLEKIRFKDRFDFVIETNDADDTLPIPPMLLQPFVENAILHGMKGKKEKGNITVRFMENEHELHCEVEDDGVGRKQKAEGSQNHNSMATDLTNDRIAYFNKVEKGADYSVNIIDLRNEIDQSLGTKVELTIPI